MAKLRWNSNRVTECRRFAIQVEKPLHEPVIYTLWLHPEDDERVREIPDLETAFYGRGGISKCKASAKRLADEFPHWDRSEANSRWV